MKNGVKIENVNECEYLGATLYSDIKHKHASEVVRNFNVSVNNLIADFSYLESTTLSRLFTSYCMNMYGSQLFRYNDRKTIDLLYVAWRKSPQNMENIT